MKGAGGEFEGLGPSQLYAESGAVQAPEGLDAFGRGVGQKEIAGRAGGLVCGGVGHEGIMSPRRARREECCLPANRTLAKGRDAFSGVRAGPLTSGLALGEALI